jgi:hypothetical protein
MQASNRMLTLAALLAVMTAGSLASAAPPAAPTSPRAPPLKGRVMRQPDGTPHKASSFAPHPTKSRVFGAPIQPPILHKAPPKKPNG